MPTPVPPPPPAAVLIASPDALARALAPLGPVGKGPIQLTCYATADGKLVACRNTGAYFDHEDGLERVARLYRAPDGVVPGAEVRVSAPVEKPYDRPPVAVDIPNLAALNTGRTSGEADVTCALGADGHLDACQADPEVTDPALAEAAARAAALYHYTPARRNGRPTAAMVALHIDFGRPPVRITRPDWLQKPTGDDVLRAYPVAAQRSGLSGRTVITCRVAVSGRVEDCHVVAEEPPATGFGEAALALSGKFRMRPQMENGEPVAGAEVTIPLAFRISGSGPLPESNPQFPATAGAGTVRLMAWAPFTAAPTAEQLAAAFPARARAQHVFGHAGFRCALQRDGRLEDCTALNADDPQDFAGAARKLIPLFRVDMALLGPMSLNDLYVPVSFDFGEAALEPAASRFLRKPDFTRQPDASTVLAAYPEAAAKTGVLTGAATMDCAVGPQGDLQGCAPVAEEPAGLGFAKAATAVAQAMQVNLWTREGAPTPGARIRLPLRFIYSGGADAAGPAAAAATPPAPK